MISAKPMIALSGVLDLVNQLAQRIRIGQGLRNLFRFLALFPFAERDFAVTAETAVGGIEGRHATDFPLPGHQPIARDAERGVAERRAHGEGAHHIGIDAVPLPIVGTR